MQVGMASCQGARSTMEDAELAQHGTFKAGNKEHAFDVFGVFDGHGGAEASAFVKENLMDYLANALQSHNPESLTDEGIFKAFKDCFEKISADYPGEDGTTATVAITLNGKVWVANVGDSRTILIDKEGQTTQASEDAKPNIARYKKKIEALGGFVTEGLGPARINGVLAVGRAIGDKGVIGVSASPKITAFPIEQFKGGHLVLACDGLYEVSTSNEVGAAVAKMAKDGESVENMSKRLVHQAIKNGSKDNVSAMVIKF
jgi:serine/threonine protein phosphatase PrpC